MNKKLHLQKMLFRRPWKRHVISLFASLIAFSPTERLSVKGQLFKKTSLLRCLSVGNVIDDKLELDHLFLAIFRKAKMRSGYNSNLNRFFILDKLISNLTLGNTSVHLIVMFTDLFFDDKESRRFHAPSLL